MTRKFTHTNIEVFHALGDTFSAGAIDGAVFWQFQKGGRVNAPPETFSRAFRKVADVRVSNEYSGEEAMLERAFDLTNHLVVRWQMNGQVTPATEEIRKTCRSTSVGDVCVCASGNIYLCMGAGWKLIYDYLADADS